MVDSFGNKLKIGDILVDTSDGDKLEVVGRSHVVWVTFQGVREHRFKDQKIRISEIKENCLVRKLSKLERVLK